MSVAHSEVTREASDGGRQPCSSPALWGWWYRGQKQRNRHTRPRYGWRGLDDAGRSEVRWSGRGGGKGKSSRTLTHLGTEGRRNGDAPATLGLSVAERRSEVARADSCGGSRAANLVVEGGGGGRGLDAAAWGGTKRFALVVEGGSNGEVRCWSSGNYVDLQ